MQNLVLISQGVFSRRTLENRPFPLKTSIAYTTLPCANALACDKIKDMNGEEIIGSFYNQQLQRTAKLWLTK
jgi:hypothetical protein